MSKINRTVLHESVPTIQEFSLGGTVRTRFDLFRDSDYRIWQYLGDVPFLVPPLSTPTSTGGILSSSNKDGKWVDTGATVLEDKLKSPEGYKLIGGLSGKLMSFDISTLVDTPNSAALNSIFKRFRDERIELYSSKPITFIIDEDVTMYGNCDLSNCVFNLKGGKVNYEDERYNYTTVASVHGYPLKELSKNLDIMDYSDELSNCLVKITSKEVDLYRYLNGVYTPKYKGEVNFHTKNGELLYSLKNTYNSPVVCTFIKLPSTRNVVKLPEFTGTVTRWAFNVRRSLVDVYCTYNNTLVQVPDNQSILSSGDTYGVNWCVQMSGIEQSSNNSRYSVLMEYVLKHTFTNSFCGLGWRAIDGNYCRDVSLYNCHMDVVAFHYGSSKITIQDSVVKSSSFGTGAHDESISIINSTIQRTGIRTDYGELKGTFDIIGSTVDVPAGRGVHGFFVCYPSNVSTSSKQPRQLFLPEGVRVQAVFKWGEGTTLNLVEFKNNYIESSTGDTFRMPTVIDFTGSVFLGLDSTFTFSTSTSTGTCIVLKPSFSSALFKVTLGVNGGKCLYNFQSNVDTSFSTPVYGDSECSITVQGGTVRGLVLTSGGVGTFKGTLSMSNTRYIVPENGGHNLHTTGWTFYNQVTFDGTEYTKKNGSKPIINVWGNSVVGNIAISAKSTDSRDVLDGKTLVCPREGEAGNF
ncbi:virion protein [Proteus phage PM16]|uniref:Virion protein n=1 Tax=Proteus phage PM16 TaxID=1357704 RepID=A0A0A6ZK95_9CAUD|nr:virion protein [Proteus phage PM16]AGZ17289.1 virion protein [Proteus phage PM16]